MVIPSWVVPILWIIGGVFVGWVIQHIFIRRVKTLAEKTVWKVDDVVVKALEPIPLALGFLVGILLALPFLPLSPSLYTHCHKGVVVLIILTITYAAIRLVLGLLHLYIAHYIPSTASLIRGVANILVWGVGFLIILQYLGISITPIITTLGIGGLAVALALQDTLSNLFAGLYLVATKYINTGDYVRLATGEEGFIVDIGWRNTTLKMLSNNLIIIPNAKLAQTIITNYQLPENALSVLVEIGVSYDEDLERVEKVVIEVAKEVRDTVEGAVKDFEPFIRYKAFGDSAILFNVILRAENFTAQYLLKHEFIKKVHQRFEKEKITIPFPIRTVYLQREG